MPDMHAHPPRRVTVIGLGGTITMTATTTGGVTPALSPAHLLTAVPDLTDAGVQVETVDLRSVPSSALTFDDLAATARLIQEQCRAGADGIVVVQGTDTIEETSYLLDLTHTGPQPVVVTGAMRNPTLPGADGPANLLAAVHTAAAPHTRGQGVLVVLADEIHAARRVRKTHTTSPATFQSPDGGPLGYLVEGQPRLVNRLTYRIAVPPPSAPRRPRVALLTITLDDDGALLTGLADRYDGLVLAALGAGHVPPPLVAPLADLAGHIPVVLASRTGAGSVLSTTYAFPGSERELLSHGLIPAGYLDPRKARVLLHTLLSATTDRELISTAVGVAGGCIAPDRWPWATTAPK